MSAALGGSLRSQLERGAPARCMQCGGAIAEVLAQLGSIRCHECRDAPESSIPVSPLPASITTSRFLLTRGPRRAGSPSWRFLSLFEPSN
jgi:hypothetical protein